MAQRELKDENTLDENIFLQNVSDYHEHTFKRVEESNKCMSKATSSAYKQTIFLTHDDWTEV